MDKTDLRESLFCDAHRFLLCPTAGNPELLSVCCHTLRELGFDLQRLDSLPIGLFPSPMVMKEGLLQAGFAAEEIAASGMVGDPRVAERLIGPIRDANGQLLSLWARHPLGLPPKYLFLGSGWKEATAAFGLDVAMPCLTDSAGELLLVEDLLDALLLQSAGLPQAAATLRFSHNLTPPRWKQLAELGVERVTLVPSDEADGLLRAVAARGASLDSGAAPEVFVLLPESFGRVKDLADFVRAMDAEAFWSWLKDNRVPRTDDVLAIASNVAPTSDAVEPLSLWVVAEDSPAIPEPSTTLLPEVPHPSDLCPFHHCDPMFCFCWD
jgi:hypothetical protein